jgi:superoxide reductase
MKERRDFLKGSLAVAGAVMLGNAGQVLAATKFPVNLIFSKDSLGRWSKVAPVHLPKVTLEGRMVKILTPHVMTQRHYIVKHTLLTSEGRFIGDKTFAYTDPAAESSYSLPEGVKGTLWATSFCNIHDFWLTEFTV